MKNNTITLFNTTIDKNGNEVFKEKIFSGLKFVVDEDNYNANMKNALYTLLSIDADNKYADTDTTAHEKENIDTWRETFREMILENGDNQRSFGNIFMILGCCALGKLPKLSTSYRLGSIGTVICALKKYDRETNAENRKALATVLKEYTDSLLHFSDYECFKNVQTTWTMAMVEDILHYYRAGIVWNAKGIREKYMNDNKLSLAILLKYLQEKAGFNNIPDTKTIMVADCNTRF